MRDARTLPVTIPRRETGSKPDTRIKAYGTDEETDEAKQTTTDEETT
jgi:hypothetical protein